jgi:hypothetical protein
MGHHAKVLRIWLGALTIFFDLCCIPVKLAKQHQAVATSAQDQSKWQAAR